jgi:hypothetical protein
MGVSCIRSILYVFPSDLPGVNPSTLNGMILYYRLMTKWSGFGDTTELSWVGLSQAARQHKGFLCWRLLRLPARERFFPIFLYNSP